MCSRIQIQMLSPFLDTFKLSLYRHEVFVFTPKGDIRTLAQGATVLDFAYLLHTQLGEHCIGANVNRTTRTIDYILQSGDQVEILTSDKQTPEPEWLEIAVTAKAKDRLKKYFRKTEGTQKTPKNPTSKPVALYIKGSNTFGVMMRILKVMSEEYKVNINDLHVTSDNDHFICEIEITCFDITTLGKMCMQLRNIGSVNTVNVTKINNRTISTNECNCEAIIEQTK